MARATAKTAKTTKGRRPRGSGHETRDAILRAAKELFAKEGYAAVTTRALAKRAGVSQTGLYVYFQTKEDIYNALCTETFAKLAERIHEGADGKESLTRLRKKLQNFILFGLENPDEYELVFMVTDPALVPLHTKDLTLAPEKQGPGIRAFLEFRQMIANHATAGVIKTLDVTLTAQLVLNALHGTVSMLIARPWYPWVDRNLLIEKAVDHIVSGLQRGEL
ncbi:MAG TPA: TetR/AcrR family transcriptional regulator [Rhizomicrobium sp.]|nr:TetR/AcrR family transcriptional regulator [Rhizomicrobium sp.]